MNESLIKNFPKAVFFDWDNTLVDTCLLSFQGINKALQELGNVPMEWDAFLNAPSLGVRSFFQQILTSEKAIIAEQIFHETLVREHLTCLAPIPGAKNLLRFLESQRIPMGVVSNKHGDILRKEIQHLGWEKYFSQIVGSYDTPEDKPSPTPLLFALDNHSLTPGPDVWFIGDSSVDMDCAKLANCTPVSVGAQADKHHFEIIRAKNCLGVYQLLSSLVKDKESIIFNNM
jgi:phosphoglycolate phosphatase